MERWSKELYMGKSKLSALVSKYFGSPRLGHTIKQTA